MDATELARRGMETRAPDHSGFSSPLEVVRAASARNEEKLRILLDWLEDEVALLVADDEGMHGGAAPRVDRVLDALRSLDAEGRAGA